MSWQMHGVAGVLRLTKKKRFSTRERAAARLAQPKERPVPTRRVSEAGSLSRRQVRGHTVWTLEPREPRADGTLVYLHGGAYISPIQPQHWDLIAELSQRVGCRVVLPLYGLAPDYEATAAVDFVCDVLDELDGPVYLMGDSAGGGLAMAATQERIARGGSSPVGLTMIAPWLDIGIRNPEVSVVEKVDPWLSSAGLHLVGETWSRAVGQDDPRVSPLFGDLEQLPPVELHVGTRDITLPDSRLLADKLAALGPDRISLHEVAGAVHVHPLLPVPEAKPARDQMVRSVAAAFAAETG